jgi:regulator of protease activity HflC (stomatin/prohibitin superfamily)
MTNYVAPLLFILLALPGAVVAIRIGATNPAAGITLMVGWALVALVAASAVRLAAEWERGVVFRLGKFLCVKGPGLFAIVPLVDQVRLIDTRVQTIQVARQQVITKDNVPVSVDAVLFFKVQSAADAVIKVQDFRFAISQYSRTSLRDVIGQMTLDQLLAEREQIESAIARHVERDTRAWGLEVTGIRMEDIGQDDDRESGRHASPHAADGRRSGAERLQYGGARVAGRTHGDRQQPQHGAQDQDRRVAAFETEQVRDDAHADSTVPIDDVHCGRRRSSGWGVV